MRTITILICKLFSFLGKCINRGSSLPGQIALKLRPLILSELKLPSTIIAVTGSNGKTSTVEMIAAILSAAGKKVVWNKEGSNLTYGIATLLLNNSNLSGHVAGDAVVMECDERFARHIFKYVKPTHFVITNLYRDQLTRNVHPFWIYDIIKDAVDLAEDSTLIINGDDPIIARFGDDRSKVCYFGMNQNEYSSDNSDALYNDCYYCPKCKGKMEYEYFHFAQLGAYTCPSCGYKRPELKYAVDGVNFEKEEISINGVPISLSFSSQYNVYNMCAAFSVAQEIGIDKETIGSTLSGFKMKNGRIVKFKAGENQGLLITSKHENSTSYNQSLEYVASETDPSMLVIIIDAISRKYYTTETSWIWDISFEILAHSNVKKIILCGKYAHDLAARFETIDLADREIIVTTDFDEMASIISAPTDLKLFAVTCFSDKDKLYSRVKVEGPTAR